MTITKQPIITPKNLGRGIRRNDGAKKFEVDLTDYVDNTTVKVTLDGKLTAPAQGGGGLDCAAIEQLPVVEFKKGTTLLGRQDDQCVQVSALDSIFQDVGLGISANKYTGLVGDKFNVKYTVTNTGEGTNPVTTLHIIKPQLGAFAISNQSHTSKGAAKVTAVSDTEYRIEGLSSGGTVVVSFDVTAQSHGAVQLGGTVDPDSALDVNPLNHRASITLSATTPVDPTLSTLTDCPLISASYEGQALYTAASISTGSGVTPTGAKTDRINFIVGAPNLAGKTLKLQNANTVVVAPGNTDTAYFATVATEDGSHYNGSRRIATATQITPDKQHPFANLTIGTPDVTFDPVSGNLVIGQSVTASALLIGMQPKGNNCRWQYVYIVCIPDTPIPVCELAVAGIDKSMYNITRQSNGLVRDVYTSEAYNVIGGPGGKILFGSAQIQAIDIAEINVPKGREHNFTVTSTSCPGVVNNVHSQGVIEVHGAGGVLTAKVLASATPNDKFGYERIKINVVD